MKRLHDAVGAAEGRSAGRRPGRWTIRARMYLQCTVAVLPLLALLAFQAVERIGTSARLQRASSRHEQALDASSNYKKFVDGATDAVDSGRLSDAAFQALSRARDASAALRSDGRPTGGADGGNPLDALVGRLASDRSTAALIATRQDMVRSGKLVDAELANRQRELREESTLQRNQANRSVTLTACVAAAVLVVTLVLIRRLASNLTTALHGAIALSHRIAEGRLDGRIEARSGSEVDDLLEALERMNAQLRAMVTDVKSTARGICETSDAVSREVSALGDRSRRQSERIEAIGGEMEHLSASVRAVAGNACATSKAASATREIVDRGNAYTQMGLSASRQVVSSVENTGASVGELSSAIATIGDVTDIITGIAKQTSLLSLNAAIEAARAGEAGRGFAIVADEVSELARAAARSAEEIAGRVRSVRTGADASVAAMSEVASRVAAGADYTKGISENFVDIASAAVDVERRSAEIARSAAEQDETTGRVAANVEAIEGLSRDNAVAIGGLAAAAGGLDRSAGTLRALMDRFTL